MTLGFWNGDMRIYVDADGLPKAVKDIIIRAAVRLRRVEVIGVTLSLGVALRPEPSRGIVVSAPGEREQPGRTARSWKVRQDCRC